MIGTKKSDEILEMFKSYRKLHPTRVSLNRFVVFCGLSQESSKRDYKLKLRSRVDKLLTAQADALGIERREFRKNNSLEDAYYYGKGHSAKLFLSKQAPVKVTRDPSLATWVPSRIEEIRRAKRAEHDARWRQSMQDVKAERAAVKNIRVRKNEGNA